MSYRIYTSGNMLVLTNTDYKDNINKTSTWRTEKLPKHKCWYEYDPTEAPIKYCLSYDRDWETHH